MGLGGRRPGAAERAPRHCMCEEDGALLGRHGLALPLPLVRQRTVRAAAGDATGHRGVLERGRLDATAVEAEVCAKALRRTEPHPLRRMVDHERVAHLLHRRVLARSVEEGAVERHRARGRRFGMFGHDELVSWLLETTTVPGQLALFGSLVRSYYQQMRSLVS